MCRSRFSLGPAARIFDSDYERSCTAREIEPSGGKLGHWLISVVAKDGCLKQKGEREREGGGGTPLRKCVIVSQ